jgi:hypothetical protein
MHSHFPTLLAGALASSLLLACGSPDEALDAPVVASPPVILEVTRPAPPCVVPIPAGFVSLMATSSGAVFVTKPDSQPEPVDPESPAPEALVHIERFRGVGCELSPDGTAPVAAAGLRDVDDLGNLFVDPADVSEPGFASTVLPDRPFGDTVAKVDTAGRASLVLSAARGLWDFGVSPAGGSLWVTACGPTGIFAFSSDVPSQFKVALEPPDTLWGQMPSALTDDHTFWSVGYRTCTPSENITPACGFALVRTTPEGSRDVGTTLVDLGQGFEETTLARCGSRVCGLLPGAVIVWGSEGEVLDTLTASDLGATSSEHIAQVSGNEHGLYVSLNGPAGARVLFVPNQQ